MARSLFAGTSADFTYRLHLAGSDQLLALAPGVVLTAWDSPSGGTHLTDLLDINSVAITYVTTDVDGQIPAFYGPDTVTQLWVDAGGERTLLVADASGAAAAATAAAATATSAASAAAASAASVNREAANGVAGLDASGALYDIRMPSRLTATSVGKLSANPGFLTTKQRPNPREASSCFYNFKGSNTRRIRAGLGRAMQGGHTVHAVLAASDGAGCTQGMTSPFSFDRLNAWPIAMRNELARHGMPIAGTGWIQTTDGNVGNDARMTAFTGSWFATTLNYLYTTTNGATLTFVPDMGGTHVSFWVYDPGTGGGAYPFYLTVNGTLIGGLTSITSGTGVWRRRTVAVNVNAGDTVLVTAGTNGMYFGGIDFWTPAQGGIEVHNISQSSSRASGTGGRAWVDTTTANALGQTWLTSPGSSRTITDGVFNATTTLASATANFTDGDIGRWVFVPAGSGVFNLLNNTARIVSITDSSHAVLDRAASGSPTGQTVQIGNDPDCIHISLGTNDLANGATAATVNAAITTIAATYPKSDIILHAIAQPGTGMVAAATFDAWVDSLYDLADTLDLPLVDGRDRQGVKTDNDNNHLMGDALAHQLPASFQGIGRQIAQRLVA